MTDTNLMLVLLGNVPVRVVSFMPPETQETVLDWYAKNCQLPRNNLTAQEIFSSTHPSAERYAVKPVLKAPKYSVGRLRNGVYEEFLVCEASGPAGALLTATGHRSDQLPCDRCGIKTGVYLTKRNGDIFYYGVESNPDQWAVKRIK